MLRRSKLTTRRPGEVCGGACWRYSTLALRKTANLRAPNYKQTRARGQEKDDGETRGTGRGATGEDEVPRRRLCLCASYGPVPPAPRPPVPSFGFHSLTVESS